MKKKFNKITSAIILFIFILQLTPFSALASGEDEQELYYAEALLYQDGYLGEIPQFVCEETESGSLSRSTLSSDLSNGVYVSYSGAMKELATAMQNRVNFCVSLTRYHVLVADILSLFSATINSNPQLFYIDNSFNYNAAGGYVTQISFKWKYSREEIDEMTEKFNAAAEDAISACMGDGMTEAEIALAGHDYIAGLVNYDMSAVNAPDKYPNAFSAYGALVEHKAVCQGISLAYKYLMNLCDVGCEFVTSEPMVHGWNAVKIDDLWYHVDITWDDPVVGFSNKQTDVDGAVYHDFFLISDSKISSNINGGTHYGWTMDVVSSDDTYFTKVYATSKKYDSYFWQSIHSKMCYKDGYFYYVKDSNIRKCKVDGTGYATVPNSSGAVAIEADQNHIYFATASALKAMSFSGGNLKTILSPSGVSTIRGLKYVNNYIYYNYVSNNNIYAKNFLYIYDYIFSAVGNNCTITSYTGDGGSVKIPERLCGYTVTAIAESAFQNKTNVTAVAFPSTVETIPQKSFVGCTALKRVDFSNEGDYTLYFGDYLITLHNESYNCSACIDKIFNASGSISVPSSILSFSVKTIGENAVKNNNNITELILPKSVSTIKNYAFYGCTNLIKVTFGDSVKSIGDYAFADCYNLSDTTVPTTLTYLGARAFSNTKLGEITMPSGVTDNYTISDTPFYNAVTKVRSGNFYASIENNKAEIISYTGLTSSVTIPSNIAGFPVVALKDGLFKNNTTIQSIVLPDCLQKIGDYAFSGCTNLKKISSESSKNLAVSTLPSSLTTLGAMVLDGTAITSIKIPSSLSTANYIVEAEAYKGPFANSSLTAVVFDDDTDVITSYLFAGCNTLKDVTLPDEVGSITKYAFADCTSLEEINLNSELFKISEFAFKGCNKLSSITLPSAFRFIGIQAFDGCSSLTSVNIPKKTEIYIPSDVENVISPFNGCSSLSTVIFEDGRDAIPAHLFENCVSLNNVVIPDSVTSVEAYAFSGCKALESLTLSQNLKTIGECAFKDTGIISLDLPNKVTCVQKQAFYNCSSLDSLTLSSSLSSLGELAFGGTAISSINIPASLKLVKTQVDENVIKGPFAGCNNLKTITFDKEATSVVSGLFADCDGIEKINLPYNIKYIGENAFACCDGIKEVYISELIKGINEKSFYKSNLCDDAESTIYYVEGSRGEEFALTFSGANACSAQALAKISKAATSSFIDGAFAYSHTNDVSALDFELISMDSQAEQEKYSDILTSINKMEIKLNINGETGFGGVSIAIPLESEFDTAKLVVYDENSNRLPCSTYYDAELNKNVMVINLLESTVITIGNSTVDNENITMADVLAAFKYVSEQKDASFTTADLLKADYDMDAEVTLLDVTKMLLFLQTV